MLIKFLPHSTGSGRAAVKYLLGERDHKGELREDVNVLRGDPELIGQLIDSLDNVHRYTSGVIAFHQDDEPTDAEVSQLLDDFEAAAFAGLDGDQYTWAAVEHVHEGVRHIHIVAPRIELTSGKAMNIAPPGWQSLFDPLRDKWNAERGWRSPADPELARDLQPGQQIRAPEWGKGDDPRQVITAWLSDLAAAGHVSDRADIVESLATLGEVTRQGKDYVSVRLDGESKPVRLKGTMYAEGWSATEAVREAEAADRGRSRGRKEPDPAAAERARRSLEEGAARRAAYNRGRYSRPPEPVAAVAEQAHADAARHAVAGPARDGAVVRPDAGRDVVHDRKDDRERQEPAHRRDSGDRRQVLPAAPGSLPAAPRPEPATEVTPDDRARKAAHAAIAAARRAAQQTSAAVGRAADAIGRAGAAAVRACRAVDADLTRWVQEKARQRAAERLQREMDERARVRLQEALETRQRAAERPEQRERSRDRGPSL